MCNQGVGVDAPTHARGHVSGEHACGHHVSGADGGVADRRMGFRVLGMGIKVVAIKP